MCDIFYKSIPTFFPNFGRKYFQSYLIKFHYENKSVAVLKSRFESDVKRLRGKLPVVNESGDYGRSC